MRNSLPLNFQKVLVSLFLIGFLFGIGNGVLAQLDPLTTDPATPVITATAASVDTEPAATDTIDLFAAGTLFLKACTKCIAPTCDGDCSNYTCPSTGTCACKDYNGSCECRCGGKNGDTTPCTK